MIFLSIVSITLDNKVKASYIEIDSQEQSLSAWGLISKEIVKAKLLKNNLGKIRFIYQGEVIEAIHTNIYSSQRNTVLAKNDQFICLTEHFLAACTLMKINGIDLELSHPELPFADGSSMLWYKFFEALQLEADTKDFGSIDLKSELLLEDDFDKSRFIKIVPSQEFLLEYRLDYERPFKMSHNYQWSEKDELTDILKARTFSNLPENKLLGYQDWVLGMDENGFDQELFFEDEAARHKALDLIGDLSLCGFNPLRLNAHIISSKGGHDLNAKAAQKLADLFGSDI